MSEVAFNYSCLTEDPWMLLIVISQLTDLTCAWEKRHGLLLKCEKKSKTSEKYSEKCSQSRVKVENLPSEAYLACLKLAKHGILLLFKF